MSEPRRTGLMKLLRESTGCQFVIPVYQRNYTWTADREVKQLISDLKHVLSGDYKNHFLGIMIYLEKSIDFSTREFSIIDGQQRLTTTFLIIYALKEILKESKEYDRVDQLENQYLTNPYHADKIKYKLKPLVSDDDVYRCIVENRFGDIKDKNSKVLKNYNYIYDNLKRIVSEGTTPNEILMALDKLYVVCVPISEEDNAQKIFESINATGVKLTSADLIRNYLLMNLDSDSQDRFYTIYWKKIEEYVASDSSTLETFFRNYLAIKEYELVSKNQVYRKFVEYVEAKSLKTEDLFKELVNYAKIYSYLNNKSIDELEECVQDPVSDYRKMRNDLQSCAIMEFTMLKEEGLITANCLSALIKSINSYLLRRSICDMDYNNISRLFPTLLKKVMEQCRLVDEDGSLLEEDYSNIVSILNQEMVGNNAGTSGSYMPNDVQMHEMLLHASVYKRPALRIILDRIELTDNPAKVDLSKLSIEHLMPQTPTQEWYDALKVDEETYMENLHRLGNLTLAAVPDNTVMRNNVWDFKKQVLKDTEHIKLNSELLKIDKWDLNSIEERTIKLIDRICEVFPYPNVKCVSEDISESDTQQTEKIISDYFNSYKEVVKNNIYTSEDGKNGYVIFASKMYRQGDKKKYWFGYRENRFKEIEDCENKYCTFICRGKNPLVINIPESYIKDHLDNLNLSMKNGSISHYHIVLFDNPDESTTILFSKPNLCEADITEFVAKRY